MLVVPLVLVCGLGLLGSIIKIAVDNRHRVQTIDTKSITITNNLSNKEIILSVDKHQLTNVSYIYETALRFCGRFGSQLGFDLQSVDQCVLPIVHYLHSHQSNQENYLYIHIYSNNNQIIDEYTINDKIINEYVDHIDNKTESQIDSKIIDKSVSQLGSETDEKLDSKIDSNITRKWNSKTDSTIDEQSDSNLDIVIESKIDSFIESTIDNQADSKIDIEKDIESKVDVDSCTDSDIRDTSANINTDSSVYLELVDSTPANKIDDTLDKESDQSIRRIRLVINDIGYLFEYLSSDDPIDISNRLANEFCRLKGGELGIPPSSDVNNRQLVDDNLRIQCIDPLATRLLHEINNSIS